MSKILIFAEEEKKRRNAAGILSFSFQQTKKIKKEKKNLLYTTLNNMINKDLWICKIVLREFK
jgi:hypothetical protein